MQLSNTRSQGWLLTEECAKRAWENWPVQTGLLGLAVRVEQFLEPFDQPQNKRDAAYRIADRMLQKARKAGLVQHVGGGKWQRAA